MQYDPVKDVYKADPQVEVQTVKVNYQDKSVNVKPPPKPPPLPPALLRPDNPDPGYFNDGLRKIDFIFVYKKSVLEDPDNSKKLQNFVTSLEEFGLEMEGEDGRVKKEFTFVKVHGKEELLMHYSKMCNISLVMDSPFYFPEKPPTLRCMRNALNNPSPEYSSLYERAPEIFAGVRPNKIHGCERIMVMAQLLKIAQFGPQTKDQGIVKLMRERIIQDVYPIHDGLPDWTEEGRLCERQVLRKYWSQMNQCFKSQPIHQIERYFGPNAAFYYAWMEFHTKLLAPLALLGLICFIGGIINMENRSDICPGPENDLDLCPPCEHYVHCRFRKLSEFCLKTKISYALDNYLTVFLAICTSIWATILIIFWKRKERKLGLTWDLDHMIISDVHRPEYNEKATKIKVSSATGLPEKYMSGKEKYCRIAITYVTCIILALLIIAIIISIGILRLTTIYYFNEHRKKFNAHITSIVIGSITSVIVTIIFSIINTLVVVKLTIMEIPRTQWEFDNSLVYKSFLMEFVNTFTPVFYLAFFKGKLFKHPGNVFKVGVAAKIQWDYCDVSGCGLELAIQLVLTMIVSHYKRFIKSFCKRVCRAFCKKIRYRILDLSRLPRWEQDFFLNDISSIHIHQEYMESVLKYGYVIFFVAVFPLAPLLAFINNIIEIRTDAYKMTNQLKRPVPKQVPGLGAWLDVIKITTHLGIATNAFIIAFTGQFISRLIYSYQVDNSVSGYIRSTLSEFNTADYPKLPNVVDDTNITKCYYAGKRYPPDHPQKYQLTDGYWFEITIKFLFAVLFEHVMVLTNHSLHLLIHKIPGSVRRRLKFERHQLRETRLMILNEAYKKRHGEIVTERSKRMKLPQATPTRRQNT